MSELLPCPFCGSQAKQYHRDEGNGWSNTDWVCCENEDCGCHTCLHETPAIAVAVWNRRDRGCPTCEGKGWVENPDARWSMDNQTGVYGTNDPEEIDCPQCMGVGFVNTRPRPPVERASASAPAPLNDDLPF